MEDRQPLNMSSGRHRFRVHYGYPAVPDEHGYVHGGRVREQRLNDVFPNRPDRYDLLYLSSSTWPPGSFRKILKTRLRGSRFVWNQDGVGYPGWAGKGYRRLNRRLKAALRAAHHVIYQSEFCRASADRFLCAPGGSWEVLPNAVDVARFRPAKASFSRPPTILLGGNQYERYRVESAIRTLARFTDLYEDARLIVTGKVAWSGDESADLQAAKDLATSLGVGERIEWTGRYPQSRAPAVYQQADLLLHTKYKDPCPSTVIEALACGLPVVYSDSGGVPELVGPSAGYAIPVEDTWDRQVPVDPKDAAEGLAWAYEHRGRLSDAARTRACARFGLDDYVTRHEALFTELMDG